MLRGEYSARPRTSFGVAPNNFIARSAALLLVFASGCARESDCSVAMDNPDSAAPNAFAFGASGGAPEAVRASTAISPSTGIRLVRMEPAMFDMGSPASEPERDTNETQHKVTLTRAYFLGACEVTQADFERIMGFNPSTAKGSARLPVETVTWFDAVAFCNRLTELDSAEFDPPLTPAYEISNIQKDGEHIVHADVRWIESSSGYRLPTEAEWEFACRGGTTTPFSFGTTVSVAQANFDGETPYNGAPKEVFKRHPIEVDALPPNAFGLRQMSGNVFEWCWDYYGAYSTEPQAKRFGCASPDYQQCLCHYGIPKKRHGVWSWG